MGVIRYRWHPGELAVVRLSANEAVPDWLPTRGFTTVSRTEAELSIVCDASVVPEGAQVERGWQLLEVLGPLAFDAVGILRQLAEPIADAGIPIIAIGTFETDYVLVPQARVVDADRALGAAGLKLTPRS